MINRIRLPFRTKWPQWPEEREVFRRADGTTKTISVVVRKTLTLETGFMPARLHERLKIALAHDNVSIENTHLLSGVSQDGGYTVDWPDFQDYPIAKATATIQITPFDATNSNCKTCEEYAQVIAEDDEFPVNAYGEGLQEGGEYNLALDENDSVCCYPAVWSLISFNSTYLAGAAINPDTGLLSVVVGTGLVAGNNILLATYRVTCPNGDYDEANVYGQVDGTIEGCFGPVGLVIDTITPTAALATWTDPDNPPDAYFWELYNTGDLGTPVITGSQPPGLPDNELTLSDLSPNTEYILFVRGECGESELSEQSSVTFTTAAASEAEQCGEYLIEMDDGTHLPENYVTVSYVDCNGDQRTTHVFNTQQRTICALQNSPGDPVQINLIGFGGEYSYTGLC